MREIEVKLRIPDSNIIISKLEALGCTLSAPITQTDINFIHRDDVRWFEPGVNDWVYPRLRIQANKPLTLTVKKPLKNESDCREHEIHIDNADELRGILDMFGYKEGVTVSKTRRTGKLQAYTITVDEVEQLGSFIEIERVVSEGDSEKIQEEMFRFTEDVLNLKRDTVVLRGYDILLYQLQETLKLSVVNNNPGTGISLV